MSRIPTVFGNEPALIPYIVAGDGGPSVTEPDPAQAVTRDHIKALVSGGADIIELGLPFSEPIADGPTIEAGIRRALNAGMTPHRFFEMVGSLDVDVPMVVMTYTNLVVQFGDNRLESFVAEAASVGIDGIIVPDLPVEESAELERLCRNYGINLIFIVAPTTHGERLTQIMERVSGFVYVQARLGTTGARSTVSEQTHAALGRLDGYEVPKAVGFGISTGDQAREIVAAGADGIVAGSVFVDIVASEEAGLPDLESKARELKAGALAGTERRESEPT